METINQSRSTSQHSFIVILGIILVATNLRAPITAVGPLLGQIQVETGLSASMLGFLTSLPVFAFAFFSLWASKLAAQYGIERVLFYSMVLLTGGILLRSTSGVPALFAGTIILGMAIAIGNVLLPSLVKRDFPRRIGFMTGLYSTSMTLFAGLASGLSIPLAVTFNWGWRGALGCWALLSVVTCLIWFKGRKGNPHQHEKVAINQQVRFASLLRSGLAWHVTLFMGFQSLGFYTIIFWLTEMLHSKGIALSTAGWLIFMMQVVSMFSMFIAPILATKRPTQHGLVLLTSLCLLCGYAALFGKGLLVAIIAIVFIGTGQGASLGIALAFFGLRSTNAEQAAALSGMAQSFGYFIAALGPIIFGFLHDWTGSWSWPLIFLILSTVVMLLAGLGSARDRFVPSESSERV